MTLFGINPLATLQALRGLPFYLRDLRAIRKQLRNTHSDFAWAELYPCFLDRVADSGLARGHYFHQDLLVARRIFENAPELHVDVGSRIDGFVAHVASFRTLEVFDIRPMATGLPNINFVRCDFMGEIPESLTSYCDSLSCLHALEHFGLGRYGDRINPDGHLIGFENLHKLLRVNGKFYFSVPIGRQRIEFNGHRVFSMKYLLSLVGERYVIDSFSFVDDNGDLFENIELTEDGVAGNFGCNLGCGIFEMTKVK
ncbi:MAG: DUF268 domain-containing protein [Desulfomonile tiedjei]|uniref:DUF268 domain-containing protein n=1 Tax=Desulfomonile tiedjei TaxID=2358 RepID=A0A9D6V2P1_9BACT|nr:DUF268 domain-containing protein [Desulfomonile tiedjei]